MIVHHHVLCFLFSTTMSTRKSDVDFSLYFVTACSEEEPGERFYDCLEEACKGGITIVQLRQKYLGTRALLQVAIKSKAITEKVRYKFFDTETV